MKLLAILFLSATLSAQTDAPNPAEQEQAYLSKAVTEAGTSAVDFTRALEKHLLKYPDSPQRPAIEKALAKSAMDSNDHARIVLYGEKILKAEPASDDLPLIDAVTRALLDTDDAETSRKALDYAVRYEGEVEAARSQEPRGHLTAAQWSVEVDKGLARALVLKARAAGNLGQTEVALKTAQRAWDAYPGSEAAREVARWLAKLGRDADAIAYLADAFTVEDTRTTEADRTRDRARMGELYTKLNGSEKGLGDVILQAWDRNAALKRDRLALLKAKDPNADATRIADFTLPRADGKGSVSIASLKGKTVVLDFWATWCGPCRAQHPMIENISRHFEKDGNVVFLSVDADEDPSLVEPFVKEMQWTDPVYLEGGLARLLNVSSIPTVLILDSDGKLSSRMAGYIPGRFEEMLTARIEEARPH